MSHPRMCVPAATYLVTRTTVMSLFLLAPSRVVNQIMEYCLAWAAQTHGIIPHCISVGSTHYHLVLTDPEGRLSEFMQEFNRSTARCLLEYYRKRFPKQRFDAVWSPATSFSHVLLVNSNAIRKAIAYTLTNPAKDGLVANYRKWPGFNSRPSDWRRGERKAKRPAFYFKNTPRALTYAMTAPTQLGEDPLAVIADVEHLIRDEQNQAAINLAAQGRSFAGVKAVLSVDPLSSPQTARPVSKLNPHLAAGGDSEALAAAIRALQSFRLAYREAWNDFKKGVTAIFPGGTLMMRRRYHVECEPLDAWWCELAVT